MGSIVWSDPIQGCRRAKSAIVFFASLDPPHLGHQWIAAELARRADVLAVLLPLSHFHKSLRPGFNALIPQRIAMVRHAFASIRAKMIVGVSHEPLFIRLSDELSDTFPHARVAFGMGDETHRKLGQSEQYFKRLGLPWSSVEASKLELLQNNAVVFARSYTKPGSISLPPALQGLSSTLVRQVVATLWAQRASPTMWEQALSSLVSAGVGSIIKRDGLYKQPPAPADHVDNGRDWSGGLDPAP